MQHFLAKIKYIQDVYDGSKTKSLHGLAKQCDLSENYILEFIKNTK